MPTVEEYDTDNEMYELLCFIYNNFYYDIRDEQDRFVVDNFVKDFLNHLKSCNKATLFNELKDRTQVEEWNDD